MLRSRLSTQTRKPPLSLPQVLLTDYLEAILANLRACVHLNAPGLAETAPTASSGGGGSGHTAAWEAGAAGAGGPEEESEGELLDPEDASECSDLDEFFGGGAAGGGPQRQEEEQGWDAVRGRACL